MKRASTAQLSLLERLESGAVDVARLLGEGPGARRIARCFELMEVAEEVLAERWPGKRGEPRGAFKLLYATAPVRFSDLLYLAHAKEMVARMPDGEIHSASDAVWHSLALLTRAEVIGLLVEASMRHPLGHADACMYEHMLTAIFPGIDLPGDALLIGASQTKLREILRCEAEWLARTSPEREDSVWELREDARREREAERLPG